MAGNHIDRGFADSLSFALKSNAPETSIFKVGKFHSIVLTDEDRERPTTVTDALQIIESVMRSESHPVTEIRVKHVFQTEQPAQN